VSYKPQKASKLHVFLLDIITGLNEMI